MNTKEKMMMQPIKNSIMEQRQLNFAEAPVQVLPQSLALFETMVEQIKR